MILGKRAAGFSIVTKPLSSVLFSLGLVSAFAVSASSQTVNDDLIRKDFAAKPSAASAGTTKRKAVPKTAKPSKPVKPVQSEEKKPEKTVKKAKSNISIYDPVPTKNSTKTYNTNLKNTVIKVPAAEAEQNNFPTAPANSSKVSLPAAEVIADDTVEQILSRFMDFEKSSTVTYKDWESVVAQTAKALQDNPDNLQAKAQNIFAQGELSFSKNDYSNALIHFNAAAALIPNSALPYYGIGRVYMAIKQPEQAEQAFNNAVKREKNFALGYKGVGDALTAQQKTKKAEEFYKKAAQVGLVKPLIGNQSDKKAPVEPVAPPVSPYLRDLNESRRLTAAKKYKESLDKLNALLADNKTADVYIAIGDNYAGLQQMLSAQQAYSKATETDQSSALAYYKLGSILFDLNEFQAASEALDKSLALDEKGSVINRQNAKKMSDKAKEKLK